VTPEIGPTDLPLRVVMCREMRMRWLRVLAGVALSVAGCGNSALRTSAPTGGAPNATAGASATGSATGTSSSGSCDSDAGDVPTFRGDVARTGRMPGPPPAVTPSVRWELHADGPLTSAPVVSRGTVYQG